MLRIDKLHLEYPFAGARMLDEILWHADVHVGRRHVGTLMKRMGIKALYCNLRTTMPGEGSQIFPYLLRGMRIDQSNQVGAMDIRDITMTLAAAVMDWATRRVLSMRVSITMTTDFCLDALNEALTLYGRPQIFNTDQGSHFTSHAFTEALPSAWMASAVGWAACLWNACSEV